MTLSCTLIKTIPRRNLKVYCCFVLKRRVNMGTHVKKTKNTKLVIIHKNSFLCSVPLHDKEHIFEVKDDDTKNFTLYQVINIIVDLTIAMLQFDLSLNPDNYRCFNPLSCAKDAANEFSMYQINFHTSKNTLLISYDFDH